jgi:two-component system, LytTR family, response regulator AlgR
MAAPINIVIADDEAPARSRLRDLLAEIPDTQLCGEAKNGKEALLLAESTEVDVLLLDIRMPQMDGIEAAQHVQKLAHVPAIIFTTAYDNYALQAFDMNAVDYLLKPIRRERLQTAINKARNLLPQQLQALKPLQAARTHFSIAERGRVLLVPVADVVYLRAELKYTTVRTRQAEYLIEDALNSLEQEFGAQFLRLHRNCLVAANAIAGYEKQKNSAGEQQWVALLKDIPETVAISRRQLQVLKSFIKALY